MAIRFLSLLLRPDLLALGPGIALGAFLYGLGGATVAAGFGLPLAALSLWRNRRTGLPPEPEDAGTPPRAAIVAALDALAGPAGGAGDRVACYSLCIDDPDALLAAHGRMSFERVLTAIEERLGAVLRPGDVLRAFGGGRFAIAAGGRRRIDLESSIQIADRLQRAACAPVVVDGATIHPPVSIGFCLPSRAPEATGAALLAAAELAQNDAWLNGPCAIRAYSPGLRQRAGTRDSLGRDLEAALDDGEIVAFFQPQLSTDTGAATGFEALARWMHPARGILSPSEFMPAVEAAGLGGRLSETILTQALSALRAWDRADLGVETVSVNFSAADLRDPNLVARLKWDLDRFDLSPRRLVVEVLESVVADTDHDIIIRNLTALSTLGCGIDLDDFGIGQASIAAIRRFSVTRIKIDRSFVSRVDTDPDQQRVVAAILSMADQLGLKTLAEGVETISEHALLSQLGCSHVQGFAIARPMPVQSSLDWLERHRRKLLRTPGLADGKAAL